MMASDITLRDGVDRELTSIEAIIAYFETSIVHITQLSFPEDTNEECETFAAYLWGSKITDLLQKSPTLHGIVDSSSFNSPKRYADYVEEALVSHISFVVVFWNNSQVISKARIDMLKTLENSAREVLAGLVYQRGARFQYLFHLPQPQFKIAIHDISPCTVYFENDLMNAFLGNEDIGSESEKAKAILRGFGEAAKGEGYNIMQHVQWIVYDFHRGLSKKEECKKRDWDALAETCPRVQRYDADTVRRVAGSRLFQRRGVSESAIKPSS